MKEPITIGAIRWDAWYGHSDDENDVCHQVENTLSQPKYHWRAPFFARINEEGDIRFSPLTQEVFDTEMRYAKDAGIGYFAYVWYEGGLGLAHKFHTTSALRKDVPLCACLDNNAIGREYARKELEALFKTDYYKTVLGGRPLMYYFGRNDEALKKRIADDIAFYRDLCARLGIPAPYAVIMGVGPEFVEAVGGDALSRYAIGARDGQSYASLDAAAKEIWERHSHLGPDNVLPLTAGWHPQPRHERPVKWMPVSADSYAAYATAEEIGQHVADAISFLNDPAHDACSPAKTAILYAWNEHDEGGWICPTIAVDENGRQLYNADGTKKIDDSRLRAVKKAIQGK